MNRSSEADNKSFMIANEVGCCVQLTWIWGANDAFLFGSFLLVLRRFMMRAYAVAQFRMFYIVLCRKDAWNRKVKFSQICAHFFEMWNVNTGFKCRAHHLVFIFKQNRHFSLFIIACEHKFQSEIVEARMSVLTERCECFEKMKICS